MHNRYLRSRTSGICLAFAFIACGSVDRDFSRHGAGGTDGGSGSAGAHDDGGAAGSSESESEAGSSADGGSDSDGGTTSTDGTPLSVISVTPSGDTATTRDAISITFNQPVTQASASSSISITDGTGDVAGSLVVDGRVVRFEPRGSLCFDQKYTVSIGDGVQTAEGTALDQESSFLFKIPDGAWQSALALAPSAAGFIGPEVDMDVDGNTLAAWMEGTVSALNYYDAKKAAWNGVVRPTFSSHGTSSATPIPRLRGVHALALFGDGVAESSNAQNWTVTATSALLGSSSYFGPAGVVIAEDDTTALVWTDSHEFKPASLWSAFHAAGGAWQAPSTAFVTPEAYSFKLLELPDNSFLAVYEHRLDQTTGGNIAARRYTKSKGWSSEKQIAAGYSPLIASNSFGDALISSDTTPVARYEYGSDKWTIMPDIAKVNEDMTVRLALAGDGTGYAVYVGGSYSANDDHIGLQRLVGNKWGKEELILPTTTDSIALAGIAADDCGDVEVVWTNTTKNIIYARRYTPAGGWLPAVTLTKVAPYAHPDRFASNAHGELVVPFRTEEAGGQEAPRAIRFQ